MKSGDFCVFYSDETEEHAMFYRSIGKKGKLKLKGVVTIGGFAYFSFFSSSFFSISFLF
jgi:hypothetical protein